MRPHLYKRPCPSVRWSVRRSVRRSVGNAFVKIAEKGTFTYDTDSAGGKERDEEEGVTRRVKK